MQYHTQVKVSVNIKKDWLHCRSILVMPANKALHMIKLAGLRPSSFTRELCRSAAEVWMTEKDKAAHKSRLILQLGRVLAPVDELAEKTPPPTNAEYQVVAASLGPDLDRWANEVSVFVTFGS